MRLSRHPCHRKKIHASPSRRWYWWSRLDVTRPSHFRGAATDYLTVINLWIRAPLSGILFENLLCSIFCIWLRSVTSCSYYSVCVSLWGLRSYSITCVNFKVPYIRENAVIYTCFVADFVYSVAYGVELRVMYWYKWLISGNTWFIEPWASNLFSGKGPYPLLRPGSLVARGKIASGVRHQLNYCGRRPPLADTCRKRNCTLNRSLGALQLSRAPLIVMNVVSVVVLRRTNVPWHGSRKSKIFQSLRHCQRNSEFWGNLFSAPCRIVCAYDAHIKTPHKLGYLYIYWRETLW